MLRPETTSSRSYITAVFDPPEVGGAPPDAFWIVKHLERFFDAADVEVRADQRLAKVNLKFTTTHQPDQTVARVANHLRSQYGWKLRGVAHYSDGNEPRSRRSTRWLKALTLARPTQERSQPTNRGV